MGHKKYNTRQHIKRERERKQERKGEMVSQGFSTSSFYKAKGSI